MIALTLFLRRWWPYLLGLAVVLTLVGLFAVWLHVHDANVRTAQALIARDTVIQTHTDTAVIRTVERRVDSVAVVRVIARVQHDTAWRHDTVRVAGDTAARVAIPLGVLLEHDSLAAACDRLNRSCAREHAADSAVIVDLRQSLALARTGSIAPHRTSWTERAVWIVVGAALDQGVRHYSH
jgi:hypothetical protein